MANKFKIGDYIVDRLERVFHITSNFEKEIINSSTKFFREAEESEIEKYHSQSS